MDEERFFNPAAEVEITRNRLPHWQQDNATYFITFRLGDSLPCSITNAWKEEREIWMWHHLKPWSVEVEVEQAR